MNIHNTPVMNSHKLVNTIVHNIIVYIYADRHSHCMYLLQIQYAQSVMYTVVCGQTYRLEFQHLAGYLLHCSLHLQIL